MDYADSVSPTSAAPNEWPHDNAQIEGDIGGDPDEDPSLRSDTSSFDPARADAAAEYLRRHWNLTGPVENLIGTLEERGILVIYRSLGSRAQDGVSSWPADPTHPPIIVVNEDLPADRHAPHAQRGQALSPGSLETSIRHVVRHQSAMS